MQFCLPVRMVAMLCVLAGLDARAASSVSLPDKVRFNRDIRPILSDNCYACHGPDKNKRKAKLRLDTREGLFDDLDGNRPVVAGQPAQSELFRRITTSDADDRMPDPASGKTLSPRDVALIKKWIEQGAKWEGHWAYQPPMRPAVPEFSKTVISRSVISGRKSDAAHTGSPNTDYSNLIDAFIRAQLEQEGLRPSREADRRTLIRRLSFDLTGLPPTPEEVASFTQDKTPQAYERLVERLLASPHYGERMAMHWLDLVRYADTDGFHADNYRSVWPYRDYIIAAFNQNLPFDRFTVEQLAGDLLPNATRAQRIASTYNRLSRTTEEGGAQAREYLAKYAADRVRTTSAVWMAGTMGCAECHDHKFDPFTARDFYSLGAFFADIKEQGVAKPEPVMVPTETDETELKRLERVIAGLEKSLETPTAELAAAQAKWEASLRADIAAGRLGWTAAKPDKAASKNGSTLTVQEDFSVLASGENPTNDNYTVTLRADRNHITAIRLEALTHPSLANGSLSRANGNFVLTTFEVETATPDGTNQPVKIAKALADFSQNDHPVANAIDGKPETGWAVNGHVTATNRAAAFIFEKPLAGGPGTVLTVKLKHQSQFAQHNIGRFRLSLISLGQPTVAEHGLPDEVFAALRVAGEKRDEPQAAALARYYRAIAPELDPVREQLAATKKQREDFTKAVPTTLVTVAVEPRVMRVLPRGNWLSDAGEIVAPAVPHFMAGAETKDRRATRLDLAQWIVSRDNPLTARVFINRLWKIFFGTGLSRTLDDLGSQGEWPTHPELLDCLAVEFMDHGWDMKHVVRLLVMSDTYRQSSECDARLRERDPFNRLLARQSRFRLDAEMVRDNALAISGLLSGKIGGPSVKPYQPAGYWDQLNFPKRKWEHDEGEAIYRRGLYTFWCRTFTHPSLVAFDAPSREECTAERVTSNTPLQALALLNDPTYVEAARVFGEKIVRHGGANTGERLDWTFARALNRRPTREEARELTMLLRQQRVRYDADKESAAQVLANGDWPAPNDLDPVEVAAWTSVARVVLNLHETIARY